MWLPEASNSSTALLAAKPDANAKPRVPFSKFAMQFSNACRVGFCDRAYSYPVCTPGECCLNVDVAKIGVITAPVVGSGDCPAWMDRVAKPCVGFSFIFSYQ